jgi:hypothetical protein
MMLAMNGVISQRTKEEYEAQFDVSCEADNDAEIFLRRVLGGQDPVTFLREVKCSFAGVWLESGNLFALRNERRPLWRVQSDSAVWYVSTADIAKRAGLRHAELLPAYDLRREYVY